MHPPPQQQADQKGLAPEGWAPAFADYHHLVRYAERLWPDLARAEVKEVVADDAHAPAFQRKRDRVWVRRAKSLMRKVG